MQESEWLNEFASSMILNGCSNVCYRNSFSCLVAQEYLVLHATIVIEML